MQKRGKNLSPKDRIKAIQARNKYFNYIKYGFFITFFISSILVIYFLWFKDLLYTKNDETLISKPTKKEVLEKRIINPEYFSYDEKKNPFSIVAKTSYKIDNDHFFLSIPKCKSLKNGENPITLEAKSGTLQESTKKLFLKEAVILKKGATVFTTNSLHFNTKTKEGYGTEPIKGVSPDKVITAGSFQIKEAGNTLCFTKGNQKKRPTLLLYTETNNHD